MEKHRQKLREYAAAAAPWLLEVLFKGIAIRALPQWTPFCGVYLPFFMAIYVKPDDCEAVEFGTVVHEFRHAWQRHSMATPFNGAFSLSCEKGLPTQGN